MPAVTTGLPGADEPVATVPAAATVHVPACVALTDVALDGITVGFDDRITVKLEEGVTVAVTADDSATVLLVSVT